MSLAYKRAGAESVMRGENSKSGLKGGPVAKVIGGVIYRAISVIRSAGKNK